MAAEESDGVGGFRVIVPSSKATRIFLLVFGSLTIIGGLITLTLGTNGVRTIEGIRLLGTGLTMLASGALFFMILWLWSVNAALLIGQGVVGYRNIFRRREFWSPARSVASSKWPSAMGGGHHSRSARSIFSGSMEGNWSFSLPACGTQTT